MPPPAPTSPPFPYTTLFRSLWFLDAASGPIAAFVTIEWDGTVGLYNSGFAPEQAALSPGVVLLTQVIRDAIARRRDKFDFLRSEEHTSELQSPMYLVCRLLL